MANRTVRWNSIPMVWVDNEDGTYSLAISGLTKDVIGKLAANSGVDIGDVTLNAGTAEFGKLGAGTAVIGKVGIDQATAGTTNLVESKPNCRRNAGVLHRSAIAAVDKLTDFANTDLSTADNGAGTGSLNASTTFYVTAIPGNRWGPCKVASTINTQATGASGLNTHSIRLTLPQGTGPNSSVAEWYDLGLSTDAAPKWVARLTEAQRAAGDYEVTAVGTVAAGGGNPAGTVDINVVGTGIQTSLGVFQQNNAYVPNVASGITTVNCTGYSKAYIHAKLALTDLRSAPALTIVPFLLQQTDADWYQANAETMNLLQQLGQSLRQVFMLDVHGLTGLRVLVSTISGQGAAASVYVELA